MKMSDSHSTFPRNKQSRLSLPPLLHFLLPPSTSGKYSKIKAREEKRREENGFKLRRNKLVIFTTEIRANTIR
jgi:hypothetical protein